MIYINILFSVHTYMRQAYSPRFKMASASNLAEQGLANIPNLELATLSYCAGCSSYTDDERTAAKTKLLEEVKSKSKKFRETKRFCGFSGCLSDIFV